MVILLLLKISVMAMIFAIGLGSKPSDVTYLMRRPGLLLRSVLAMYVLVPLVALGLVTVLPIGPGAKGALLILAVSAGAPLLPKKLGKIGNDAYVLSLVILSSLLAIGMVPAWVELLSRYFHAELEISALQIAGILGKAFLAPLALGMVLGIVMPGVAPRLAERILTVATIVLALCGLVLLVTQFKWFFEVRLPGLGALAALLVIALGIGHWLGGPDPKDRTVLAISCATRHLGIAILVASSIPGPLTAILIVTYLIVSIAVTVPYLKWRGKAAPAAAPAGAAGR